ncbi:hypothetical protein BH23GEM6_BH23GEM6_25920 [soil metagenome]
MSTINHTTQYSDRSRPAELRLCRCLDRRLEDSSAMTVAVVVAGWRAGLPVCSDECIAEVWDALEVEMSDGGAEMPTAVLRHAVVTAATWLADNLERSA